MRSLRQECLTIPPPLQSVSPYDIAETLIQKFDAAALALWAERHVVAPELLADDVDAGTSAEEVLEARRKRYLAALRRASEEHLERELTEYGMYPHKFHPMYIAMVAASYLKIHTMVVVAFPHCAT